MRSSLKLGKFAGVNVHVHGTFLLILGLVAWAHWADEGNLLAVVVGLAFFLAFFACILLHEFGHVLTARRYGVNTRGIVLLPIGGVALMERIPEKPRQELLVTLAGPAVNFAIAGLLYAVLALAGRAPAGLAVADAPFFESLMAINVWVALFNLVPAFPMDGGRILRALLAMRMDRPRATAIAARTGKAAAIVFAVVGFFYNFFLIIIAIFVWTGATDENEMVQRQAAGGGPCVGDAMQTMLTALSPQIPLGEVVRLARTADQDAFPVVRRGRLLGLLRRADLDAALARWGPDTPVQEAMEEGVEVLGAYDPLLHAWERLQANGGRTLPVVRHGRLAGLISVERLAALLRAAQAGSGGTIR